MSLTNVAASVRQRLLNRARETGEDYQVLLTRYALERLLYRLGQSDEGERFVLKGAYAFLLWQGESHRQTRDLDLLGHGAPDAERLSEVFRHVCTVDTPDDGVEFNAGSVQAAPIRDQAEYDGIRVTLTAHIDTARLPLQVDVGFGDAVTPPPRPEPFPALLEFPKPTVRVYPRETAVAEKLHGIVLFGIANSRMRDYYDLWYLAKQFAFDGATVAEAIAATFERRNTPLPPEKPQGLTDAFASDDQKRRQWKAFLQNRHLGIDADALPVTVETIAAFLTPPLEALIEERSFARHWPAGGPWTSPNQ
jgi:predicted nucleotidyltransferase component of viral defense system